MTNLRVRVSKPIGEVFQPVFIGGNRVRYRGLYGGRGSGKSTDTAQMAVVQTIQHPGNFLCCRELQKSIKDSVHSLIKEQIFNLGASECFEIGETFIRSRIHSDSQFLFYGLRSNPAEIKSMNRLRWAWVEEAQAVSQRSLDMLSPTVRMDESEIWFTWNPDDEQDPVHNMMVNNTPDNAIVRKVNWNDNPFFPAVLEQERQRTLKFAPDRYEWIWNGNFNINHDGAVYGKWMNNAENEGRIRKDLYDPDLPVHTAWDLGFSDDTAIWFWQQAGNEIRFIDYYENNREGIKHYAEQIYGREIIVTQYGDSGKVLKWEFGKDLDSAYRKEWVMGDHFVPHDAANKLLQAGGRSAVQQLYEFGIKCRVVGATSQQNQIDGLRLTLETSYFDAERCKAGIRCLKKYQFLLDEARNKYSDKPDHDEYSHGCDAAEVVAQVWKSSIIKPPDAAPKFLEQMTANDLFWGDTVSKGGHNKI